MASSIFTYNYDGTTSFYLSKWKIKVGYPLVYSSSILSYKQEDCSNPDLKEPILKYKSNVGGNVTDLLVSEGDLIQPGTPLLKVQRCTHPVIMKDLCAECGIDLRDLDRDKFEKLTAATSISMVHVVPELKVSFEQAEKLGRDDEDMLLKNKKLVLLVDLDQTLIHTTNDNVPADLQGVCHFQLYGKHSPWYHTKLRPGTKNFLENISKYYELHICTFGARLYAHKIAKLLDPKGKFFSHRILSRDECFDSTSKTGNLKALFPRGDHMVCIIDDREDVWSYVPNVIRVKPYTYFQNTGDINAPGITANEMEQAKNVKVTNNEKCVINDKPEIEKSGNVQDKPNEETNSDTKVNEIPSAQSDDTLNVKPNTKSNEKSAETNAKASDNSEKSKNGDDSMLVSVPQVTQNSKSSSKKTILGPNNKKVDAARDKANNTDVESSENKSEEEKNADFFGDFNEGDDYLLYLEEILVRVHKAFYDLYANNTKNKNPIPDLKCVVPTVRKKVLKDVSIVFSSAIPKNCVPESHHFWTVAESLGARVTKEMVVDSPGQNTTHIVGVKPGTIKVNAAKRYKDIKIVTIDWLLCCDERWEHADERLFPLPTDPSAEIEDVEKLVPKHRQSQCKRIRSSSKKRTKSEEDKFSERIFAEAGLAFTQEEIADMGREVEDACSEESDGNSQKSSDSSDSSSVESLSSGDYPKGWKRRRKCEPLAEEELLKDVAEDTSDAETIGSVDEEMAEAVKNEFQNF